MRQDALFCMNTVTRMRRGMNATAHAIMVLGALAVALLVIGLVGALVVRAMPILSEHSLRELLTSCTWQPLRSMFGFLPFIVGTCWVTGLSIVMAVPVCLLAAIYLADYAGRRLRTWMHLLVDILAAIPSVVYGMWGVVVIVPFIKQVLAPAFGVHASGYCVLAGGIVLAVMIAPLLIQVFYDVLRTVPREMREASFVLGATEWQTTKHVVVRHALPGLIAGTVLGLSRAFGETMAVLMVVGNVARLPHSLFDPAYPLPALIANNYGEMMSVPLYDAALLMAALLLFGIVVIFNIAARLVLTGMYGRRGRS